MKGSVYKRCGCTDPNTGRALDRACPKLKGSKHGTWFYVVELPAGPAGKRRQQRRGGFPTQTAASDALSAVLQRVNSGLFTDISRLNVGSYLDEWLAGKGRLRPSTRASYDHIIDAHLKPALGHVLLADLRGTHIEGMVRALRQGPRARPIGPATARRIFATLRAALNKAVRQGLIAVNPCTFVELESEEQHRNPGRAWTPIQVGCFLDSVAEDRLSALFEVAVKAGLRRGEVIGLRWTDCDLDHGQIVVAQSVVLVGGEQIVGSPKTKKSHRVVPLDPDTVTLLRSHKRRQLEERLAAGAAWTDTGRVFTNDDGTGLRPDLLTRQFQALAAEAGLPVIRFHDLRHTSASLALAGGVPMRVVSERLGHSTIGITQDLYTHVFDHLGRQAAQQIADAIPRAAR